MNKKGDTSVTWDPINAEATAIAEQKFNDLKTEGHLMTEVQGGVAQDQVNSFNPEAEEIVAVRPIQGG